MEESFLLRDVLIFLFKHAVKIATVFLVMVGIIAVEKRMRRFNPPQPPAFLAKQGEADQNRLTELEARREVTEPTGPYAEIEHDAVIDDAKTQLLALRLEELHVFKRLGANHPRVAHLRNQFQMIQALMSSHENKSPEPVRIDTPVLGQSIEPELVALKDKFRAETGKHVSREEPTERLGEDVQGVMLRDKAYDAIERGRALTDPRDPSGLRQLEQARHVFERDGQNISPINVVQDVVILPLSTAPRLKASIAAGMMFATFVAVGIALLCQWLSRKLSTPESAEKHLGLQVLTTVPYKTGS